MCAKFIHKNMVLLMNRRRVFGIIGGTVLGILGIVKLPTLNNAAKKVDVRIINNDVVENRFNIEVVQGGRDFDGTTTLEPDSSYVFENALADGALESVSKLTIDISSRKSIGYKFKLEPETDVFEIEYLDTGRARFRQIE